LAGRALRVVAGVAVALGALGAMASTARAQVAGQPSGQGPGFICATSASAPGDAPASSGGPSGPYLPIDRWASVAGSDLHTRLSGGFFGFSDIGQEANRELQSLALSVGNTLWQGGTDLVSLAGQFCFAGQVAVAIDHAAATVGDAIASSGLMMAVVVLAVAVLLWRRHRSGESPWGPALRMAVVLGIFAAMLAGATATRAGPGGRAELGTFSPGWLIDEVYGTVSSLASAPTEAIAAQPTGLTGVASEGPASCGAYVASLESDYKATYGPGPTFAASLPLALNDMWEQAGLATYTEVQFGAGNPYGAWAYCHQLDFNAGYSATDQAAVAGQSLPAGAQVYSSALAWPGPGEDNATVDASVVGWAACEGYPGHWGIPAPWASTGVSPQVCDQWWQSAGVPSQLDWGTSTSKVTQAAAAAPDGAELADFLLNYHGDANGTADAAAITYAMSSVVVFAVFALLAGAVLVAKVALLVMILLLGAAALLSMWPGAGQGRLGQVGRYTLGLVVFATGAQLLVALVALVTGIVSEMVSSFAGQGSFLDVLAMGVAPVAAVYILHFVFTKVLRAPSPFKLSGALAWASSAGAVGAGVASLVDRQVDQRGRRMGLALARSAKSAVLARYGAPRPERMGAMKPAGAPGGSRRLPAPAPRPAPGAPAGTGALAGGLAGGGLGGHKGAGTVTPPAPGTTGGASGGTGGAAATGRGSGPSAGAPGWQGRGGTARGRPEAGTPDGKNPHAVALGRLGAQARYGRPFPGRREGDGADTPRGPWASHRASAGPPAGGGVASGAPLRGREADGSGGSAGAGYWPAGAPAGAGGVVGGGARIPEAPQGAVAAATGAVAGAAAGGAAREGAGLGDESWSARARAWAGAPQGDAPGAMGPAGEETGPSGDMAGPAGGQDQAPSGPGPAGRPSEGASEPEGASEGEGGPAAGEPDGARQDAGAAWPTGASGAARGTGAARRATDGASSGGASLTGDVSRPSSTGEDAGRPGGGRAYARPRPGHDRPGAMGPSDEDGPPHVDGPAPESTSQEEPPSSEGRTSGDRGQPSPGDRPPPEELRQVPRPGEGAAVAPTPSWRRLAAEAHQAERRQREEEREALRKGLAALREAEGGQVERARAMARDRARLAVERARNRPMHTVLRAGRAVGVAALGGTVALAGAPFAAGVAAVYAGHRMLRWRAEAPARRAERDRRREAALAAYRARQGSEARPG
jgi:hypothetical protein